MDDLSKPAFDPRISPLRVVYALLRKSVRIRMEGQIELLERARKGEAMIFASRHGQLLPLLFAVERYGLSIVISRSRDGELLAALLRPYGFHFVRGSTSLGGRVAALAALRTLARGESLGLAVDGPHGPRGIVQEGVLRLARRAAVPIVPLVATGGSKVVLRKSWDHFELPLPVSRVRVQVKSPVLVGEGAQGLDAAGRSLARQLEGNWRDELLLQPQPPAHSTYGHTGS